MPDNGFGAKNNSGDFLIRACYIRPDFKTAQGGSGSVSVGDYISFRDPSHLFGFTIVNETSPERRLTGGDIDPESLQRDHNGDLWVGDEFGPWILHFSADGVLLDPPFQIPGLRSPNNPGLGGHVKGCQLIPVRNRDAPGALSQSAERPSLDFCAAKGGIMRRSVGCAIFGVEERPHPAGRPAGGLLRRAGPPEWRTGTGSATVGR
jgi:hypothetical protein